MSELAFNMLKSILPIFGTDFLEPLLVKALKAAKKKVAETDNEVDNMVFDVLIEAVNDDITEKVENYKPNIGKGKG